MYITYAVSVFYLKYHSDEYIKQNAAVNLTSSEMKCIGFSGSIFLLCYNEIWLFIM